MEVPGKCVPLYPNPNTNKQSAYQAFEKFLEQSGGKEEIISKKEFKLQLMEYVVHVYQNRVKIKRIE